MRNRQFSYKKRGTKNEKFNKAYRNGNFVFALFGRLKYIENEKFLSIYTFSAGGYDIREMKIFHIT